MVHVAFVPEEKVEVLSAAIMRRESAMGFNQATTDVPQKGLVYLSDSGHCWLTDGVGNKLQNKPTPVHRIGHGSGFWEGFQPGPDAGFEWWDVTGAKIFAAPDTTTGTYNGMYQLVVETSPGDTTCWQMEVLKKEGAQWEERNP
jgi:hypothetical protein